MGASGRLGAARGAVPARESASGRSELERGARTAAGGRRGEYASAYLSKKYKTKTSQQDGAEETDDIVGWLLLLTA